MKTKKNGKVRHAIYTTSGGFVRKYKCKLKYGGNLPKRKRAPSLKKGRMI